MRFWYQSLYLPSCSPELTSYYWPPRGAMVILKGTRDKGVGEKHAGRNEEQGSLWAYTSWGRGSESQVTASPGRLEAQLGGSIDPP